jgi:hypothetical protein
VLRFLEKTAGPGRRDLAFEAGVIVTVVSSVAEAVTANSPTPDELRRWADTIGSMLANQFGIED